MPRQVVPSAQVGDRLRRHADQSSDVCVRQTSFFVFPERCRVDALPATAVRPPQGGRPLRKPPPVVALTEPFPRKLEQGDQARQAGFQGGAALTVVGYAECWRACASPFLENGLSG